MKYSELPRCGVVPTEIQAFLAEGDNASVITRIPGNLRDAAKEAAVLGGANFTLLVKICLIEKLVDMGKCDS